MPSAVAEAGVPRALAASLSGLEEALGSQHARSELLARAFELTSGRERPGRFWKIDLDALDYSALHPQNGEAPAIAHGGSRGVVACDLLTASRMHADLLERALARAASAAGRKFAALSAALRNTGAFVYVPRDTACDEPIEITYSATRAGLFPYTLVFCDRGSRATIVERVRGEAASFHCAITELVAEESASICYAIDQRLPDDARSLWTRIAHPASDASITWNIAELGSELSCGTVDVLMSHRGAQAEINTLFFPYGNQHVDIVSTVAHDAGESTSDTVVKSAATGSGMARYLGNIRIAPHAQATDARLRDDALLLSPKAHIDSVPALEIAANDVKAYHGATVGALDEDQIFYMESRGIARTQAERMIALGFFEPVIERFPSAALRDELRATLEAKIGA